MRRSWISRIGRSTPNVCWHLKLRSRKSIDSAPRSRTSAASDVTFASSMPSDSTMSLPTPACTSGRVQIFAVSGSMRLPASLADAAVHGDDLARDVARVLRREEHRERGHFLGPPDAPHRDPLPDLRRGHADEGRLMSVSIRPGAMAFTVTPRGLSAVAHIRLMDEGVAARRLDRLQRLLRPLVLLAIVDADRRPCTRETRGDRPADPTRRAGHERDPTGQVDLRGHR